MESINNIEINNNNNNNNNLNNINNNNFSNTLELNENKKEDKEKDKENKERDKDNLNQDKDKEKEKEKISEEEIKNLMEELKSNQPLTAQSHIKRLLNSNFISPYDVLCIPSEATEEEIKKQFRQLTLLLHPDKCSDINAVEAFQGK
jgi:DnaJ family protein C protein 8